MKITVDIDCTPEEARTFLGLPDMKPFHNAFMQKMREKMSSGLSSDDMQKMFDLWMTPGLKQAGQSMEAFQNMFWNASKTSNK
ncbi:MAG: hypothetical protein JKY91_03360 [Emcibacter sp.]|nr:hypothetical protein [Emcibacter sp.]MBL4894264.1 hypothetical protein [Emcibacter sp.]